MKNTTNVTTEIVQHDDCIVIEVYSDLETKPLEMKVYTEEDAEYFDNLFNRLPNIEAAINLLTKNR